jgi:thymidylate kinase
MAKQEPRRYKIVDASKRPAELHEDILRVVSRTMSEFV